MSYRYINRPVPVPVAEYAGAIEFLLRKFEKIDGLKSIYRFGNITTPGISDLDILVVFEDNCECHLSGFEDMPDRFRNVFTHGIMAMNETHFNLNNRFTLWSAYELLGGSTQNTIPVNRDEVSEQALRTQTAIEFISANYIDLKVQQAYKTFKLRSLLQHMKGIGYDLEYLGITDSPLHEPITQLKSWILNWFRSTPTDAEISQWLNRWIPLFDEFSNEILTKHRMYLPEMPKYKVAGNQEIRNSEFLSAERNGILAPAMLSGFVKKYFNVQNKLNTFTFGIPLTSNPAHPLLTERFLFLREMKNYNRRYLPHFMTMTTSITSKLI